MQLTLLGIVAALLAVWLYVRHRNRVATEETRSQAAPRKTGDTAYHAVSIKLDTNACEAAKEMTGRRFLSSAAPRLPLPGCDALECRCRFIHHKDRRAGKDRRSPFAAAGYGGATGSFEKERRERSDRRRSDDADKF